MQNNAVDSHVSADGNAAGCRGAWNNDGRVTFAHRIKHGVCLGTQVAAQGAVDSFVKECRIGAFEHFGNVEDTVVGRFRVNATAVCRESDTFTICQGIDIPVHDIQDCIR